MTTKLLTVKKKKKKQKILIRKQKFVSSTLLKISMENLKDLKIIWCLRIFKNSENQCSCKLII